MLDEQRKQQEALWQKQSHRLIEIVRNNEGVWLSAKLFYIVGSLSLLSIITIVLEIAFYVYSKGTTEKKDSFRRIPSELSDIRAVPD